jgi:hypothetical protein
MIEDSKNIETEDDEEGAREEIKEEVHELQDSESEEIEEDDLDPEEE